MKKILSLTLAAVLLLGLFGCTVQEQPSESKPAVTETTGVSEIPPPTETSAPQQHGTAKQRAFMSMKRLCLFLPFISEPCIRTLKTMSSQEPTSASGRPNNFPLFRSTSATAMLSIHGLQAIPMWQPLTRQPVLSPIPVRTEERKLRLRELRQDRPQTELIRPQWQQQR